MKLYIYVVIISIISVPLKAQELLEHKNQVCKTPDGKLIVNRHLPAYFYISTSPDAKSKQFRLESTKHKQYTNPMYWGLEGKNIFRSPYCVDTVSKQVVKPKRNIQFEVYADSKPPTTLVNFFGAKSAKHDGQIYYGKNLQVSLNSVDKLSGLSAIYFSINNADYQKYDSKLDFEGIDASSYNLKIYAVDNVGNIEDIIQKSFIVDITPPRIRHVLQGVQKGENVLSKDSYIVVKASDDLSGVQSIFYSIDNKPYKIFTGKINLAEMAGGHHKLIYYAVDYVGNTSRIKKTKQLDGSVIQNFNFVLDKTGPLTDIKFRGDTFKGKYLFISEKTSIKITSADRESGTAYIFYGIDSHARTDTFIEEFSLKNKSGIHKINYTAMDNLTNIAKAKSSVVFVDNKAPITSIDYKTPKFFNRDSLFINNKTKIVLNPRDEQSGIKKTMYAIDSNEFVEYDKNIILNKSGFHTIKFHSFDNVNNQEETRISTCVVDDIPPEIYVNFSIEPIGNEKKMMKTYPVYPPYTRIYLGATDTYSGTQDIYYAINGLHKQKYTSSKSIADKNLLSKEGFYKVKVTATDKLGNESSKTVKFFVRK